jgi:CDP-paratose 2-epimerase
MNWSYTETNRVGDHIWWIGDNGRFETHYPEWNLTYDVEAILAEMFEFNTERWAV